MKPSRILVSLHQNAYHTIHIGYKTMAGTKKQGKDRRRASTLARISGQELAGLWNSAIIFAPHLSGCMCAGGFHVPLDPAAVEQDLIEFLLYRYRDEGLDALAAHVEARAINRKSSFNIWLAELEEAPLSGAERQRVIDDLATTLESMNAMGGNPRGEIICY